MPHPLYVVRIWFLALGLKVVLFGVLLGFVPLESWQALVWVSWGHEVLGAKVYLLGLDHLAKCEDHPLMGTLQPLVAATEIVFGQRLEVGL